MPNNILIFVYTTKPSWEKRCCYPSSGRFADARLGDCADPNSPIRTSTIDQTCDSGTWNWHIWVELMLGLIFLLTSVTIYMASFFIEYHEATTDAREYVSFLYSWVNASKKMGSYLDDFVEFNRFVSGKPAPRAGQHAIAKIV